jgi:hypothetical protein
MAGASGHWQLAQDVLDVKTSNPLFHAYDPLEFARTRPTRNCSPMESQSNAIYIFDNKVNRNRIVASWDGRYHHYKIFQPGDDTAWLRAVETPPVSDQLQAMVSQVQSALPGIPCADEQNRRRAGQRGERDFKFERYARRDAADAHEFRPHQRAIARAGRSDGLGAGHERQRTIARLA